MKVSIITVCYNSGSTICDTIESVLSQTYSNIEYIVIDGGSTDSTKKIVDKYKGFVTHFISEPDKGIYDAMNKGIALATGEIVGILNSDDFFSSNDSISKIIREFQNGEVDAVFADLKYVKQDEPNRFSRLYSSKNFSKWKMRFGFMVPHPTFYTKRALFEKLGNYKLSYRVAADFELMARFFSKGIEFRRSPHVIVSMREGGISSSGIAWRIHQNFEIVRACKENGIYTNIFFVGLKLPFKLLNFLKR